MSRELPIILDNESVWAIRAGRKTQMRMPIDPQPKKQCRWMCKHGDEWQQYWTRGGGVVVVIGNVDTHRKPRYQPGDLLWVKETWPVYQTVNHIRRLNGGAFNEVSDGVYAYKADGYDTIQDLRDHIGEQDVGDLVAFEVKDNKWQSPVAMPKKATRLWLRVTDVRAERLLDISNGDIRREGAASFGCVTHSLNMEVYWDRLNAKKGYPWKDNPWVWVYEFNVERR